MYLPCVLYRQLRSTIGDEIKKTLRIFVFANKVTDASTVELLSYAYVNKAEEVIYSKHFLLTLKQNLDKMALKKQTT